MIEKIKAYFGIVGGYLVAIIGMLTYIFIIKEKNRDLVESNSTLKAELALTKTEVLEKEAGKDADAKEADFDSTLAEYNKQSTNGSGTNKP